MELYVDILENEYNILRGLYLKGDDFITLFIKDKIGCIEDGIIKQKNAYYFYEYEKNTNRFQLVSLNISKHSYALNSYENYRKVSSKFINEWSKIGMIKLMDNKVKKRISIENVEEQTEEEYDPLVFIEDGENVLPYESAMEP